LGFLVNSFLPFPVINLTSTIYDQDGGAGGARNISSEQNRAGVLILAGMSGIDKYINKIEFSLKKLNSPTGTYKFTVRDDSDTIIASTDDTDVSGAPASFTHVELTLDDTVQILEGYRILVEYSGGGSPNYLQMEDQKSGAPSGTNETIYATSYTNSTRRPYATFDSDPTI